MNGRRHQGTLVALAALCVLGAACGSETNPAGDPRAGSSRTSAAPPMSTAPPGTETPPSSPAPPPPFTSAVAAIDDALAARMTASWRPGCPVPLDELRRVTVAHWDFDLAVRTGVLVVHADAADAIVEVFRALYEARFPVQQIRLVDDFGGDDNRSMAANNTSAFNCRPATGSNRWSEHAYGRAIDINPIQNPFITASGAVLPPEGAPTSSVIPPRPG